MIKYEDLTPYERELINKIDLDPRLETIEFALLFTSVIHKDLFPKACQDKSKIQIFNVFTFRRIEEFLIENDFIKKVGADYLKLPKTNDLRKADSIEEYYNQVGENHALELRLRENQKTLNTNDIIEGKNILKGIWKKNKSWLGALLIGLIILFLSIIAHLFNML